MEHFVDEKHIVKKKAILSINAFANYV